MPINWLLTFISISLYGIFLRGQVGRYRNLFIENRQPQTSVSLPMADEPTTKTTTSHELQSSTLQRGVMMAVGLLVLVLIAESMESLIETGINDLGLPSSLGGPLVGVLVVAPEALNALQAAGKGERQRSLNTLYG